MGANESAGYKKIAFFGHLHVDGINHLMVCFAGLHSLSLSLATINGYIEAKADSDMYHEITSMKGTFFIHCSALDIKFKCLGICRNLLLQSLLV